MKLIKINTMLKFFSAVIHNYGEILKKKVVTTSKNCEI